MGAAGRYGLSRAMVGADWPMAVFSANLLGSLLIGALAALPAVREADPRVAAFLMTGVLGGFTTFSTFSLDVVTMADAGRVGAAALYAGGSLAACVAGCALGMMVIRGVSG
ncbi:Putative fluoride ion transporter CrcB [Pontivivens insulae]|uniref:Fluoride-specific ion channel FluC n=1 Tax=Pontivivens insulae TaxID=1639689 RepID=A0A2R8A6U3_9RHOB|nr:camphor resistance protein CrcB [Pontivivens insulae]SPF27740.1 Putative fluoride ion transporter CrcB [Pontivivens insulae]